MTPRQLRPALVLSVWTLLVWTTRINNIWADDELTTAGQIGRTALALSFTVLALGPVVAAVRARRSGAVPAWTAGWIRAFAVWTIAVWLVRAVQIATADHGAAFIAVHVVLAAASIGLAAWADRAVNLVGTSRTGRRFDGEAVAVDR